ncbi:L-seryl-tRNA(Sec) selenium transferase [Desulfovibrio litoralis]|uniref:L-seryl-tRNA(Sec) selenium transferase n=1 Tax=Desulfovibrio litoralis DSM 11393 TaxID=1121455 RepID=A0A1M7SM32_9BACT|nr:L-seryl-tRNA(Sec) selenium transferase [Desulfovibrio litoralis]SHN59525.1 L-seryl-tRNA(Sec) selenium transferase [Desulfovibrio litoralis DSM 11393]
MSKENNKNNNQAKEIQTTEQKNLFRALPSMDLVLERCEVNLSELSLPFLLTRTLLKEYIGLFLDQIRRDIVIGKIQDKASLSLEVLMPNLLGFVYKKAKPHFRRVVNATGVVIHTNLGRSLLAESATKAVLEASSYYSNLEFDLNSGERGSRYNHVTELLQKLSGAESALVVNNNAAAVLLVIDTLCKGREVIVSRGELVEIGGSFRIPEVIERSGCILKEVGATNCSHLYDFERAISPETAAILKVHTSNFRIIGFTEQPSLNELAKLAHKHDLPLIKDLGSGSLFDFSEVGLQILADEPTVQQVVDADADIVTFSGDKVLGGPQAGIIVGKEKYIAQIRKNPLNRALRIDKMTLAALEATLRLYTDKKLAREQIPTLAMLTAEPELLKEKAYNLAQMLRSELNSSFNINCVGGSSRVGGGAFPEKDLPTTLVRIESDKFSADKIKKLLLEADTPIVGRIEKEAFCLDPRTLLESEYAFILGALKGILG